ncbi:hypothetical protein JCM10295v2_002512 [Rhodotorula toruloides]
MLNHALSNRLHPPPNTSHAPLILISDSLLQPALLILRQFVSDALIGSDGSSSSVTGRGRVVLLCCEQDPAKLLPPNGTHDERRVTVLDASFDSQLLPSLPSTSTSQGPRTTYPSRATLQSEILSAVKEGNGEGGVTVVLDSVNALGDYLEGGEGESMRCLKKVWEALRGQKGSRLILVHHSDFPPFPSSSFSSSTAPLHPSLPAALLSPTFSPSTAHLTLRPSAHIELLSRDYGLSFPSSLSSDDEIDPRTKAFLESLAHKAVADPFVRPRGAEEEDERVVLDSLGAGARRASGGEGRREGSQGLGGGGCVVEYEVRGLEPPSTGAKERKPAPRTASSAATASKKLVRWGLVGARAREFRAENGSADVQVEECAVGEVLDRRRMGVRAGVGRAASTPPVPAPSTSSTPAPPPPSSSSSAAPDSSAPLPFSLSLTPSQRLARSLVSNPFAGADKPIYGESGYAAPVLPGTATAAVGGGIEYTPDRGDDWDDEDPDEDLEL